MTTALQFIVPALAGLGLLGLFHVIAHLHLLLAGDEPTPADEELSEVPQF